MEFIVNARYVTCCIWVVLSIPIEYFCMVVPPFMMQVKFACVHQSVRQERPSGKSVLTWGNVSGILIKLSYCNATNFKYLFSNFIKKVEYLFVFIR